MKKTNFLFRLSFLLLIGVAHQAYADKPKAKGYYLDASGEKVVGMVQVPTKLLSDKASAVQVNKLTFFTKKGVKIELDAATTTEIGFTYEGENITFRVLPKVIQEVTRIDADFYRVIVDGPCTLYHSYVMYKDGATPYFCVYKDESHFYQSSGMTSKLIQPRGRVNDLEVLFEDCPELVAKIKNKEFKKGDDRYSEIVQYYNKSCQSTEKESEKVDE